MRKKKRVSRQDWLNAALDLLISDGIDAVRVERLSLILSVSKSGFYYHFRDRSDLYDALLQHWKDIDHAPQRQLARHPEATPQERLRIVADAVDVADLGRYDFAIRQWARKEPKVRRAWRAEMKIRVTVIRELFMRLGFEGDELEMRTRLFVAYQTTEREMYPDVTSKARARLRDLQLKFLTTPPLQATDSPE